MPFNMDHAKHVGAPIRIQKKEKKSFFGERTRMGRTMFRKWSSAGEKRTQPKRKARCPSHARAHGGRRAAATRSTDGGFLAWLPRMSSACRARSPQADAVRNGCSWTDKRCGAGARAGQRTVAACGRHAACLHSRASSPFPLASSARGIEAAQAGWGG